ncbi:substrate-binding domain-containing protein [uncultured Cohaesibacter sp.]|uniref:substrate-binding domain-containing protein n=1 Tax=uncultured Cohaesibacter sp. TaxID=1002546 RepID=UPI0029C94D42|nr:substrate-binding domain-containing protein [uncultured Cohaesibacter sp.]
MKRFSVFLLSTALMVNAAAAVTIGTTMSKKDAFVSILTDNIRDAASKTSGVTLDLVVANMDKETQINQVKTFIENDVDAIIVNAVADEHSELMQKMAAEANIPLVYVNRQPPQSRFPGPVSVVSCNELVAGRLQMRMMANEVGGKGNVVILNGALSHPAAKARTVGAKEVLAQYPGLSIVHEQTANWSRDEAEKIITGLLDKGVKIDIIAANNDEMAIGAVRAIEKAGLSFEDVMIGGVDATPAAIAEMEAGKIKVTVLQNAAAQGLQSIKNAIAMAQGGYAQEFDWIPWEVVVPSNMENYK